MNNKTIITAILFISCLSFKGLSMASPAAVDIELRKLIDEYQLTGTPLLQKAKTNINSPLAKLGKRLFFSTLLSGQEDTACVSCHHPFLGGGDRLSLSIGVDAIDPDIIGPGRKHSPRGFDYDGGPPVARNAPTTFNAVFYSRCMFWDCGLESLGATPGLNGDDGSIMRTPDTMWGMPAMPATTLLQSQASFPVSGEDEMRGKFMEDEDKTDLRDALVNRLISQSDIWHTDFQQAFGDKPPGEELITFENITQAIAAYEASQIFINTPWQRYTQKKDNHAISQQAKQGALLFFRTREQGGYACNQCHSGDFFTDEKFHVLAIPQIGRGKEDGPYEDHDYGRFMLTGNHNDKYSFRTPSLLNVEVTGPYGHSGAYRDLRNVIRHMINPEKTISDYDFNLKKLDSSIQKEHAKENTLEVLKHLTTLQSTGFTQFKSQAINEEHVDQIHAFLLSLTDPCVKDKDCLASWVEE